MSNNETPITNYQTTKELHKIGLYYRKEHTLFDSFTFYSYDKRKKTLSAKKVYTSKKNTEYIKHKGANYTIDTLTWNILAESIIEKGIDNKFSHRDRVKEVSLLTRVLNWFRG